MYILFLDRCSCMFRPQRDIFRLLNKNYLYQRLLNYVEIDYFLDRRYQTYLSLRYFKRIHYCSLYKGVHRVLLYHISLFNFRV